MELIESPEVQALTTEATGLERRAQALTIASDEDLTLATDTLGVIAKIKKQLEEKRTFFVKPLNDQVKRINEMFKAWSAPLDRADQIIRGKVLAYRQEQERRRREEEERLRKLAEKEHARLVRQAEKRGETPPPPPPVPVIPQTAKTVAGTVGSVTTRKEWDFEIVDETLIPREYLMVNEAKIRAVVRAGVRNIPGVRIFEREVLAVRAR